MQQSSPLRRGTPVHKQDWMGRGGAKGSGRGSVREHKVTRPTGRASQLQGVWKESACKGHELPLAGAVPRGRSKQRREISFQAPSSATHSTNIDRASARDVRDPAAGSGPSPARNPRLSACSPASRAALAAAHLFPRPRRECGGRLGSPRALAWLAALPTRTPAVPEPLRPNPRAFGAGGRRERGRGRRTRPWEPSAPVLGWPSKDRRTR